MRAVVQRVSQASVEVDGRVHGAIADGLLVYLAVEASDENKDVMYLTDKVRHLRIFPDEADRMNRSVEQAGGKVLVVSAFTVQADARRGRRPSFENAAPPDHARVMYERFCEELAGMGIEVARGAFREFMNVQSVNAGPVCILLDSRRVF